MKLPIQSSPVVRNGMIAAAPDRGITLSYCPPICPPLIQQCSCGNKPEDYNCWVDCLNQQGKDKYFGCCCDCPEVQACNLFGEAKQCCQLGGR